jgi:hypothetical protein
VFGLLIGAGISEQPDCVYAECEKYSANNGHGDAQTHQFDDFWPRHV